MKKKKRMLNKKILQSTEQKAINCIYNLQYSKKKVLFKHRRTSMPVKKEMQRNLLMMNTYSRESLDLVTQIARERKAKRSSYIESHDLIDVH